MREHSLKLELHRDVEQQPASVYYKEDGQRFELSKTIKLAAESSYLVDVQVKPFYANIR